MQNINLAELINQHKNKVFNTCIIIAAVIVAYNIYTKQMKDIALLKGRIDTETKKNVVLEGIRQLERKTDAYKGLINNKDISLVMNKLTEMTKEFAINVVSLRPETTQDFPLYLKHIFNLKLEVKNYHSLGKFISRLESHSDLYALDIIRVMPTYNVPTGGSNKLNVEMTVSTVLLKD